MSEADLRRSKAWGRRTLAGRRALAGPSEAEAERWRRPALIQQEDMRVLGGPVTEWTSRDLVFVTKSGYPASPY